MTRFRRIADTTFRSLHTRNYRLYFTGQIISVSGTWMQSVALAWLVVHYLAPKGQRGVDIDLSYVTYQHSATKSFSAKFEELFGPARAPSMKLDVKTEDGQTFFELELQDAWVWDMYRPARFVAADRLGLSIDDIEVVEGDTARVQFGNGTWGSRSISVGGAAIYVACDKIITKARRIAGHILEADEADLVYENQFFYVPNTNSKLSFAEIAKIAYNGARLPAREGFEPGLEFTVFHDPPDLNDPLAMHLAVVIVDPDDCDTTDPAFWRDLEETFLGMSN